MILNYFILLSKGSVILGGIMKKFLLLLLLGLGFAFTSHSSSRDVLCIAGTAAAFYGVSYGINWLTTYNKPVNVDLKDFLGEESAQETTLFAHGIAETHKQALWYTSMQKPYAHLIEGSLYTYDFPDATKRFWRVNFTKTALGQEYEVKGLESAYTQLISRDPDKKIILMGMSRGASTILNFAAKQQPKNIKAIVIESPFDSTASIVNNILQKCSLDKVPGMQTLGHYLMSAIFWKHSPNGMQSINFVEKIDKNIPILFICSREDKLVPAQSTVSLYNQLKKSGHERVHIFVAESGKHGRILHGDDGINYEKATNAFYKKYGLSCNKERAKEGMTLLDNL